MVRPYICNNDVIYIEKDSYLIGAESLCRDNKELALVLTYKFNGYNVVITCFKKLNNAHSKVWKNFKSICCKNNVNYKLLPYGAIELYF